MTSKNEYNFNVYCRRSEIPTREEWQELIDSKKLPLCLPNDFDPPNHPVCSEVGHPRYELRVAIGGVIGRYRLEIHNDVSEYASYFLEAEDFDVTFGFRWDYANGADCLAAYLSGATLLLATGGEIVWDLYQDKSRAGKKAYQYLTRQGWERIKARIRNDNLKLNRQDPFGPPLEPVMLKESERRGTTLDMECPRCGVPFALDSGTYDGEKHTLCGQMITIPKRPSLLSRVMSLAGHKSKG